MKHIRGVMLGFIFLCLVAPVLGACSKRHYSEIDGNEVTLYLEDPEAITVIFISSLDNFKHHKALNIDKKVWKVVVRANKDFEYFYLVDDVITLPRCKESVMDDFGSRNCLFSANL